MLAGACLFAALAGDASQAMAQTDPARETLLAMTQELADALAPADKRVWDQYADPDLLYVSEDDEVSDKARFLDELKPLPKGFGGTILVTGFQLRHQGDVAVTTYELAEAEWVEGHLIHDRFRETDTWRNTPMGWRLLSAHVMAVNKDPPSISIPLAELQHYAGHYVFSPTTSEVIRAEAGHLTGASLHTGDASHPADLPARRNRKIHRVRQAARRRGPALAQGLAGSHWTGFESTGALDRSIWPSRRQWIRMSGNGTGTIELSRPHPAHR